MAGLRNSCDGFAYSIDVKEDNLDSLCSHLGQSFLDVERAVLFRPFAFNGCVCGEVMLRAGRFAAPGCSAPRTVSRTAVK